MPDATFATPDVTTFCRLDELGLVVVGQHLQPDRAVLACRVADDAVEEADRWCRRCGCEGRPRDTVTRRLAHEPVGWRPTTLLLSIRRYRCAGCEHVWREDTSRAAEPRAKLTRTALRWALVGLVCQHLTVARLAEALAVSWSTANTAVLAEGQRVLLDDPTRFDGVKVIGVDEHVWRHTRRGDKFVTVVIDLTPVRDKTGPSRLLAMVEGLPPSPAATAFDELPADADDPTRHALAVRLFPRSGTLRVMLPRLWSGTTGSTAAARTVDEAVRDLYTPAQSDVLRRVGRLLGSRPARSALHRSASQSGEVGGPDTELGSHPGQCPPVGRADVVEEDLTDGAHVGRRRGDDHGTPGLGQRRHGVPTVPGIRRPGDPAPLLEALDDVGEPRERPVGQMGQLAHPDPVLGHVGHVTEHEVLEQRQPRRRLQRRLETTGQQQDQRDQARPGLLLLRIQPRQLIRAASRPVRRHVGIVAGST